MDQRRLGYFNRLGSENVRFNKAYASISEVYPCLRSFVPIVSPDSILALVLLLGAWAYHAMPRAQYPEVDLNWVAVAVVWPGATAQDVEREIALPLEAAARRVSDVRFVAATSRDHVATLLVRFNDLDHARFERRLAALDREIRQASADFPKESRLPQIIELTSSNFFPTAMVVVSAGDASSVQDGRVCELAEATRGSWKNCRAWDVSGLTACAAVNSLFLLIRRRWNNVAFPSRH